MEAVNQANLAVVIRFQICIFDILNTADPQMEDWNFML